MGLISTSVKKSIKEAALPKTKDINATKIKESPEIWENKSPIESQIHSIENNSLESLKVQNELDAEKIKEAKISQIWKNREAGASREERALEKIQKEFPESDGYKILREQYLRDENGTIVKDTETGEARRIDFIVSKNNVVVKSIEVTSETAPKDAQISKEFRIRNEGGNYIKDPTTRELIKIPETVKTEIWRYE